MIVVIAMRQVSLAYFAAQYCAWLFSRFIVCLVTNETLFTDNYTKTPTNTPSPFRLCITHIVQLRIVNSQ